MSVMVDRICDFCKATYKNEYLSGGKYSYTIPTRFCSKSCASKSRADAPSSPISKDPGKEVVLAEIRDFISTQGRYCTQEEILGSIRRSSKTIHKHGISTVGLNKELGHSKISTQFQSKVEAVLKDVYDEVEVEKTFDGLVGNTGYPLRVDFYLPELNVAIEADGCQHYDINHPWATFKNGTVKEYDSIKERFFKEKNIRLIRVPYKKRIKTEEILSIVTDV